MSSQLNVTTAVRRDLAEPPALAAEMGVLYLVVGTRKQRFDQKGVYTMTICSASARLGLTAMALWLPGLLPNARSAPQTPARKSAAKAAHDATKSDPKGERPKFKAIWEPVNVKEDLELRSVHFVTADEGW